MQTHNPTTLLFTKQVRIKLLLLKIIKALKAPDSTIQERNPSFT